MDWQRILPVLVSMGIIVAVAVARGYSTTVAGITATMPVNVTLGLWIVYAAERGDTGTVTQFTGTMLAAIWPTVFYLLAVWLASRAGWRILPMLAAGFVTWALGIALLFRLRAVIGV